MAYSTSNPPKCLVPGVAGAPSLWTYSSADNQAAVRVSGYFTDGFELGIRAGDFLLMTDTDDYAGAIMICNAASASAVDFTDGTAIATTDSD